MKILSLYSHSKISHSKPILLSSMKERRYTAVQNVVVGKVVLKEASYSH